jgi:hypothetical protein
VIETRDGHELVRTRWIHEPASEERIGHG